MTGSAGRRIATLYNGMHHRMGCFGKAQARQRPHCTRVEREVVCPDLVRSRGRQRPWAMGGHASPWPLSRHLQSVQPPQPSATVLSLNCALSQCAPNTPLLQAPAPVRHRQRGDIQAHRRMPTRYTSSHARQIRPEPARLRKQLTEQTTRALRAGHSGQPAKIAPFERDTAEAKRIRSPSR